MILIVSLGLYEDMEEEVTWLRSVIQKYQKGLTIAIKYGDIEKEKEYLREIITSFDRVNEIEKELKLKV